MGPRPQLLICAFKTACLPPKLIVSMGPRPDLWFLHAKQRLWTKITSLYVSQTSPVVLCLQNKVICTRMTSLYGFQHSCVVLCIQNSDFRTRLIRLYGSQISPVDLCMQISEFSTRITSLYGPQTSPVVLCMQNSVNGTKLQGSMSPRPHLWFCACKTACLASELLVSMGP